MSDEASISEDSILKATGRSWREWFEVLEGAGMQNRPYDEILTFLREEHGVPSWWQQLIANEFETSLGRRKPHEAQESRAARDGHDIEITRLLDLPAAKVYLAWADDNERARWMRRGDFEPSTLTAPRTVRGKWLADGSQLEMEVDEAGEGRCALSVRHRRIPDVAAAERMKQFWKVSLDRMVERISK